MFTYPVSQVADALCFLNVCAMLESSLPGLEKGALIADEGGMFQHYTLYGKTVTVNNDCGKDAVFVESELDLSHIFN
jgi:hypothetical protein